MGVRRREFPESTIKERRFLLNLGGTTLQLRDLDGLKTVGKERKPVSLDISCAHCS